MADKLVEIIKREEFNCPKTRTMRTRDGGTFEVPLAEALAGIEAGTHRAPGHSLGKIPADWGSATKSKKAKATPEPQPEAKED